VLSIGNDVYCDTFLISDALERAFPESDGYPSLYPKGKKGAPIDRVLVKTFFHFWGDTHLFPHGAGLVPWEKVTDIQQDRMGLFGKTVDQMVARRPTLLSSLQSHLLLLEEQLHDGRVWMMNTVAPGVADATIFIFLTWFVSFRQVREAFSLEKQYPKSNAWLGRFKSFIEQKESSSNAEFKPISVEESVDIMRNSTSSFNLTVNEADAKLWGVQPGSQVAVSPTDENVPVPTIGELIGLDLNEAVLKTVGKPGVPVRVHFPRIEYTLQDAKTLGKSRL